MDVVLTAHGNPVLADGREHCTRRRHVMREAPRRQPRRDRAARLPRRSELGIATVAVVAPDDKGSLHARSADETVEIASYLFSEEHIRAAKQTGADAIHPGYGFLAENPDFAEAVQRRGADLGRPAAGGAARRRRQARGEADRAARRACRSCRPASRTRSASRSSSRRRPAAAAAACASSADAGGARRGARAARREAKAAFGDDRVFCERYVERPRHVEIQLLADEHGTCSRSASATARSSGATRRCSRSHPPRRSTRRLRAAMSDAAVAFARAIGYESAGTAEFMVDGGDFWFLELNGRIQVEHPVTELVTGVDLVQAQLRIAAGERARRAARPARARGRGAAVRRGPADVLPADRAASSGCGCPAGIRVDAGVAEGDEVGIAYDPMIAKLIAHGTTRDEAFARLHAALRETEVERRDDEPPVPALARRASGRARRRHDDGVPRRASAALPRAGAAPAAPWRTPFRLNLPSPAPAPPPDVDAAAATTAARRRARAASPRRCPEPSSGSSSQQGDSCGRASRSSCSRR